MRPNFTGDCQKKKKSLGARVYCTYYLLAKRRTLSIVAAELCGAYSGGICVSLVRVAIGFGAGGVEFVGKRANDLGLVGFYPTPSLPLL